MPLSFVLTTADPLNPQDPPDMAGAVGYIRLWLDDVASDRWVIVTEAWDGVTGTQLKVADIQKFRGEMDKVFTQIKSAFTNYSLAQNRRFRMDLKIPGAWLNGY